MEPVTLGVIIGNRDVFPGELAESGRKEVLQVLKERGVDAVVLPAGESRNGAIGDLAEARKCADLFNRHRERIDGVLVSLPNFGDERSIADALRLSALDVPVFVHAFSDELDKMDIRHRRDSFCGKISVCNVLRQYGIPYSIGPAHTTSPSSRGFVSDIEWFAGVCRVVKGMRRARIGCIGARVAPFKTIRYSEKLLERSGISVDTVDLSEIITAIQSVDDNQSELLAKLDALTHYSNAGCVDPATLRKIAKLGVVIDSWVLENDLHAVAVQCWPAMQGALQIFPCLLMSLMNSSLVPAACEVDVAGAVSAYALQLASGRPSAVMDWNNNYGEDPDKMVLFHCSNLPVCMMDDARTSYNPIAAQFAGEANSYATAVGRIRSGPFTFARISTDDSRGVINACVGEGEFTDDPLESFGGLGVVRVERLPQLLRWLCLNGFEHHVAISHSASARILDEAMANYLDWQVYHHTEKTRAS